MDSLTKLLKRCKWVNIRICLTHVQGQPMKVLNKMEFIVKSGERNIYETETELIEEAFDYVKHLEAS